MDQAGNVYMASESHMVYKLDTNGTLTRVAGNLHAGFSGDNGPAVNAQLNVPQGVAVDGAGNLYIADGGNARIRKVTPDGIIVTLAGTGAIGQSGDGGPAVNATLSYPTGVAVDASGNLYFSDRQAHKIRKVAANGVITTIAGNGSPGFADNVAAIDGQLNYPWNIVLDAAGNLYIADSWNCRIRKIAGGTITTIAGNGTCDDTGDNGAAVNASLSYPRGLAVDAAGNLSITGGGIGVRRINTSGIITTIADRGNSAFRAMAGQRSARSWVPCMAWRRTPPATCLSRTMPSGGCAKCRYRASSVRWLGAELATAD